jgi:hypothetical protein
MVRTFFGLAVSIAIVVGVPVHASAQSADGTWKLSYLTAGNDLVAAIVKMQTKDGKATGELVAGSPRLKGLELVSVNQDGKLLRITLKTPAIEVAFEANVPANPGKRIGGVLSVGDSLFPAELNQTADSELDLKNSLKAIDCPPLQQAKTLTAKANSLRLQAQLSKDAEKKKDLLKQAVEAEAVAKKETPKLYREVIEKHADSPGVFDASLALIKAAKPGETKVEEIKAWADAGANVAKSYGPRWQGEYAYQVANLLVTQDAYAKAALDYARQAEKALPEKASANDESRVLNLVVRALKKNDMAADAKAYEARFAKIEEKLDAEYSAKMPGFKGTAFEGRKGKSDRAVFMELFTGATCPPCVAADLAFDVLQKSYKPSELVLIQYHVHIPGPDPMTNPGTVDRWKYYTGAFPKDVRGVPSSLFNGKPQGGGGGGAAAAENKYNAYRTIIDPLLEDPSTAKIKAAATRKGDKVEINVSADVAAPGEEKKLRLLLTEETVRYPGSNKIRLHHNVVRAFPNGVNGTALTEASTKFTSTVDISELRAGLNKYLDDYQLNVRPFLNPARPLEMSHLRVVAYVQDDATHEILQAIQVEVK